MHVSLLEAKLLFLPTAKWHFRESGCRARFKIRFDALILWAGHRHNHLPGNDAHDRELRTARTNVLRAIHALLAKR